MQSAFIPSNQRVDVINSSTAQVKPARGEQRGPQERQLTIMLVCVCVAFVCLRLPYTVSYALSEYTRPTNGSRSAADDLPYFVASQITDVIATTNYVVNFFLYGLCGSYFREQVRAAFRCRRGEWLCLTRRRTSATTFPPTTTW